VLDQQVEPAGVGRDDLGVPRRAVEHHRGERLGVEERHPVADALLLALDPGGGVVPTHRAGLGEPGVERVEHGDEQPRAGAEVPVGQSGADARAPRDAGDLEVAGLAELLGRRVEDPASRPVASRRRPEDHPDS
jgi:hypothetical protein